jgi:hypothetical protein
LKYVGFDDFLHISLLILNSHGKAGSTTPISV